ncbi:MAG: hypothetical protein A2940_00430 [Candidatus Wildermuthbacteria bacterium RIFCSPLOWO2_01_FULL_48_29]|uniref:Type 4 fimbrial biogenesis protein PilX N-terminal domain-containing protein n=1 Tax=Candidatus Wildermuthbacteria bacterium RIFCSPLOWO2_01_FULL_48_29 TaxID=1802462 RepID=A0A1G2RML3_9BACT|nr:MAG: hypothetical protein A2940_00430 [Candidatus Wildermuthbacteria bacterium RIFCSPLOWO2_01_FULL_48_29]
MKLETLKEEKGITIYLVLIVLVVTLGASLGLSSIFLRQLRLVGGVGVSMPAYHAAEAGAERLLRLDTCLIMEDETERLTCIEEVSGIDNADIPADCEGAGEPGDERDCRTGVVEEMNLLPEAERTLDNGAQYDFAIEDPGGDCEGNNDWGYCATSTGSFEGVVRRVEIVR